MTAQNVAAILDVKDGWIVCPVCRKTMHGIRIGPDTAAEGIALRCRRCRLELTVNIDRGQRVYRPRP